jgi:hypothetical protein
MANSVDLNEGFKSVFGDIVSDRGHRSFMLRKRHDWTAATGAIKATMVFMPLGRLCCSEILLVSNIPDL